MSAVVAAANQPRLSAGEQQTVAQQHGMTERELAQYQVLFEVLDADNSQTLDVDEIRHFFRTLGLELDSEEVFDIVLDLDVDRSGELEFTEFATVCHILRQEYLEEAERVAWQRDQSWRKSLWRLFEEPSSSPLARAIGFVIITMIGLSVLFFCAETVPELDEVPPALWHWSEVAFTAAFTVEYLLRLWSSPEKGPFFRSLMNAVDLFAIAPFYIEVFANIATAPLSRGLGTGSFRVVRLIRIFRVFKLSRYSKHLQLFVATWAKSAPAMAMVLFVAFINVVLFGALVYVADRGEWHEGTREYIPDTGPPSDMESVPLTMWFVLIVQGSVGYGDLVPSTTWGKVITHVAAIVGVLLLAIPLAVFSASFSAISAKGVVAQPQIRRRLGSSRFGRDAQEVARALSLPVHTLVDRIQESQVVEERRRRRRLRRQQKQRRQQQKQQQQMQQQQMQHHHHHQQLPRKRQLELDIHTGTGLHIPQQQQGARPTSAREVQSPVPAHFRELTIAGGGSAQAAEEKQDRRVESAPSPSQSGKTPAEEAAEWRSGLSAAGAHHSAYGLAHEGGSTADGASYGGMTAPSEADLSYSSASEGPTPTKGGREGGTTLTEARSIQRARARLQRRLEQRQRLAQLIEGGGTHVMNVLATQSEIAAAFEDDACRLPAKVAAPAPRTGGHATSPSGGAAEAEERPGAQKLFASLFGGVREEDVRRELTEAFVYGSADIWLRDAVDDLIESANEAMFARMRVAGRHTYVDCRGRVRKMWAQHMYGRHAAATAIQRTFRKLRRTRASTPPRRQPVGAAVCTPSPLRRSSTPQEAGAGPE